MDIMQPDHQELLLKAELAIIENNPHNILSATSTYLSHFPSSTSSPSMVLAKAKAQSQLNEPQQVLETLQSLPPLTSLRSVPPLPLRPPSPVPSPQSITTPTYSSIQQECSILKIRSHLQLKNPKQAEKEIQELMGKNQQIKAILELDRCVRVFADQFRVHQLTFNQKKLLQDMRVWLETAGARYEKLALAMLGGGYRGVIATRHIKKKQQIVFIPRSELITLQMSRNCEITQPLRGQKQKLQSPKHTYLSLLLLQLKSSPTSKYSPYISLLPTDHSSFPINYSTQQLQLLNGSPFLQMVYEKVIDLKNDYGVVLGVGIQGVLFREFCWARMMVGSRIFGILMHGVKTDVLAPFADMLNHRHPKQTVWNYDEGLNGFCIESQQDIEVGQQVFDSYGRKCNSRFLLNYGFVIQDNPDNQIPILVTIYKTDMLAAEKKKMIQYNIDEEYLEVRKITQNLYNNKFFQLMGVLRFICIDEDKVLAMLKKISNIENTKEPYLMIRTPPLSIKNEILALERLRATCKEQLSKYPTSLQEDQETLKYPNLSNNKRNIKILLIGEKTLLTHFISITAKMIAVLKSPDVVEALHSVVKEVYAKYLFKILCMIPGVNKKTIEDRIGPYFSTVDPNQQEQVEQIPQS